MIRIRTERGEDDMQTADGSGADRLFLHALLEGAFSGVVFVDGAGRVLLMNDRARSYLNCREAEMEGENILNLFPLLDRDILNAVLEGGDSIANYSVRSRSAQFAVNIEPLDDGGTLAGAVLILRRIHAQAPEPPQGAPGLTARHRFSDFQYASVDFQRALKNAKLAASCDAPILLTGEDGTEVPEIAECIHNESARRSFGYAEVECDAHSAEQISRLLFEQSDKAEGTDLGGAISSIRGGTLFLNHVDRLTQELQYRVCLLIRGQYTAQNDIHHYKENVRVIAGTEKRLKDLVRQGLFREDLYYALSAVTIMVPPLRERRDDIIRIANLFLKRYSIQFTKPVKFTRGAYDSLQQYAWPGNVRELDFFCRKIVLTTPSHSVNEAFIKAALNESIEGLRPAAEAPAEEAPQLDKRAQEILDALRRNQWSKTKTAAALGVSKATLWRHMQKYGIGGDRG